MSIFGSIRDAIFGHKAAAPASAPVEAYPPSPAMPQMNTASDPGNPPPAAEAAPAPIAAAPVAPVDVVAILTEKALGQNLNWKTSIVDLMKLLGLDSSHENRVALARELGYTGDIGDSAAMNIWLHKQVMAKLAASGGLVPAELTD